MKSWSPYELELQAVYKCNCIRDFNLTHNKNIEIVNFDGVKVC